MHEDQVTDAMIESMVAEAEAGYAVEPLKRRGRGRPGRGARPVLVVAVRLTSDELAALDRVVEREHLSRSEAIRRALNNYAA
ncbi:CopG family transcriptional regulator [Dermacoccus nishinomiyaensis]|uniref:ribbon-helix-helix protein, CopG family n=1 Tax=Dermacoccus TaxID=57495 RepID=UPI0001E64636|nr:MULTISPECIES: ribbon-helix-helix protein, CopG family [Dermacoccus]EFP57759.1 Ribbon-helix-helix protein, CopG family [Dermacoccus sp. Ellin185]QQY25621.1 CopG family transcriptional regulator [Dermacoccus nishinomiyaensis]STD16912.1 Ribbon-helix-helix protein, copG family [Dermacoccus nishinomiyaensis]